MFWSKSMIYGAVLLAALVFSFPAAADDPPDEFVVVDGDTLWLVPTMEIVGTRVTAGLPGIVRTVETVDEDDMARLPGRSVAELLQMVPGVVVGQRQQLGVQSDLTIRGSTFEQVQVLLDGFDLGDPQTGHHLMDLPVGRNDLQRLEVLPGHGSVLYGSGAFGGTVNVVTRRPALPDSSGYPLVGRGQAAMFGGQDGTWGGWADTDLALGQTTGVRLSGSGFRTDGYYVDQPDGSRVWGGNDADTWSTTARFLSTFDRGEADVFAGYSNRQFGAQDFYAPFSSYEKTRAFFTTARYKKTVSNRVTLEPRIFYRRHADEFILLRENPDTYTNDHLTHKVGAELRGLIDLGAGYALSLSSEGAYEDIESQGLRAGVWGQALGNHLRRRASFAGEIDSHRDRWRWQLGGRLDSRTNYAPHYSGSGAVSFAASRFWSVRASAGSVYRIPTFTELYYTDPANRGDPNLQPEKGWTWDAGVQYNRGPWSGYAAYFTRYEDDLIEWARPQPVAEEIPEPWQVMNVGEGTVRGAEVRAGWRSSRGHGAAVSYVGLDKTTSLPSGLEGKYTLLTPDHQLVLQGTIVLQTGLEFTLAGRYLHHTDGPPDFRTSFVLDSRLDWRHPAGWFASITGTNLLDRRYEEIPGVQMPGTLFTTTVGWRF